MPERPIEEVLEVFERHRTIRHYTADKIPASDLAKIMQAGRRAPSDATGFMYTVIRVSARARRGRIAQLSGDQQHIVDASDFFLVCLDFRRQNRLLEHLGAKRAPLGVWSLLFGITDAILVAENMAVAAEALGNGTGFIGGVQRNPSEIAREVGLPAGVYPVVGLTMGVPSRAVEPRKRLPLEATFHEDTYHDQSDAEVDRCFEAMRSESGKFDWAATLKRYFGEGGEMERREAIIRVALAAQGLSL